MAIKLTNNVQLVSFTQITLGFTPRNSVVLHLSCGTTLICTLRVDAHPVAGGAWARQVMETLQQVSAQLDSSILVSYEDEYAMTTAQYEELGDLLAQAGMPLRKAVLVTDGKIMDYDRDSTDAVDYEEALIEPINLAHMVNAPAPRHADEVPPCHEEPDAMATARTAQAAAIDGYHVSTIDELAARVHDELLEQLVTYRQVGTTSEEQAGWIAGTFQTRLGRDVFLAVLATGANRDKDVPAALMGEESIENRELFTAGANMIFDALEFIPNAYRPNILAGLAWTRWMQGKGSLALEFLGLSREIDPEHTLTELFTRLIMSGKLPASATTPPTN